MAKAIWGGSIGFGMAHIPVDLFTATRENDVKFKRWDPVTQQYPRQKNVVDVDGQDQPIETKDMSKVYEYLTPPDLGSTKGGKAVVEITDSDLEALHPISSRHMQITEFVPLDTVDPIYIEKTYFLLPRSKDVEIPYTLFCEAIKLEEVGAIVRVTMRTKEHLAMIHMNGDSLCLSLLFYSDEIVSENSRFYRYTEVSVDAIAMARKLVQTETVEAYDPTRYENEQQKAILEMIYAKAQGVEVDREPIEFPVAPVGDICDILAAQLEKVAA